LYERKFWLPRRGIPFWEKGLGGTDQRGKVDPRMEDRGLFTAACMDEKTAERKGWTGSSGKLEAHGLAAGTRVAFGFDAIREHPT